MNGNPRACVLLTTPTTFVNDQAYIELNIAGARSRPIAVYVKAIPFAVPFKYAGLELFISCVAVKKEPLTSKRDRKICKHKHIHKKGVFLMTVSAIIK